MQEKNTHPDWLSQALKSHIPAFGWVWNKDSEKAEIHGDMTALTGVPVPMTAEDMAERLIGEDSELFLTAWHNSLNSGENLDQLCRLRDPSGTLHHLRISGEPVLNRKKQVTRIKLAILDITRSNGLEKMWCDAQHEIATLGRELQRVQNRKESAQSLHVGLLNGLSTECRVPLAIIRSTLERLQRDVDQTETYHGQYLHRLDRIDQALQRLGQVINNAEAAAKLDEGERYISLKNLDAKQMLEQLATSWQSRLIEHPFIYELPKNDTVFIRGHGDFLRLALSCLLDNASRFSKPDQAIHLSLTLSDETVTIAVSDEGIGIPLREQDRIFDRFSQASSGHGRGGMGLGLHIARRVAELHHGNLKVDSRIGAGACFTLTLPRLTQVSRVLKTG